MSDTDMILTRARFQELEQRLAKADADKDELLDALKWLAALDFNENGNSLVYDLACRKARAAIAKAEGLS